MNIYNFNNIQFIQIIKINYIINELVELSEYNIYGARKIEKLIKNKIENIIIDSILDNNKLINIDSILSK